jgi:hypothetical protein
MRRFFVLSLLAVAAGVCLVSRIDGAEGAGSVQFLTPRHLATAVGSATATLQVTPPGGATVVSVVLLVDGARLGTTTSAPWMFSWEAGDGTTGHKLDAIAKFSDGTEARASVSTSRLAVNEIEEVALVNVYAIAHGPKGTYVNDLQQKDFPRFRERTPASSRPVLRRAAAAPDRHRARHVSLDGG